MKVLLTGAAGMLAQAFLNKKPRDWSLDAVDIDSFDIADRATVQEAVLKFAPEIIINCAAFTRVDECEEKREIAFAVNGEAVGYLAEAANKIGTRLVHFSSDYIFDGTKGAPYDEDDPANPVSIYGASKWEGEYQLRKHMENHLIIRTQWLYGHGGNHFAKTILNLAEKQDVLRVVDDQIGSPTWTEDLAEATLALIDKGVTGTYHVVNAGQCSWHRFACRIIDEAGLKTQVIPCTTAEFPRPARRPAYSVLSTEKASATIGRSLPTWELALQRFMRSV